MATLKDKLPNRALNGAELLECAVDEFRRMLMTDYAFNKGAAYRRVAFTLSATFHLGTPHEVHELKSRVKANAEGTITGEAPLPNNGEDDEQSVLGKERDVVLENGNLDRIHHGLPITQQRVEMQQRPTDKAVLPGEPIDLVQQLNVVTDEFRYDPATFPPAAAPVDRDTSEAAAHKIGVPSRVKKHK